MDNRGKEKWVPILGYEGKYEVSDKGRIKRLPYLSECFTRTRKYKFTRSFKGGILKGSICKNGYVRVTLTKDAKQTYHHVHSLVAQAFIPNPCNLPCVNHINECKTDNRVENLEWCSYSYNNKYNNSILRAQQTRRKIYRRPVRIAKIDSGFIKDFDSQYEAAEYLGTTKEMILRAANKGRKTCKGFVVDFI